MLTRSKTSARILVLILAVATVMAFTPLTGWTQEAYAGTATVTVNGMDVSTHAYWKWDSTLETPTYVEGTSENYNIHYSVDNSGVVDLELKDDDHFTSVNIGDGDCVVKLNNVKINSTNSSAIDIVNGALTIQLAGKNYITANSSGGIKLAECDGIIGTTSSESRETTEGAINITGTGSLNITARDYAINTDTQLTIQSGSVTATSTDTDDYTLGAYVVSIEGGRVVANATNKTAIMGYSRVSISGGTVIANSLGEDGLAMANGQTGVGVSITGGAVYAHGNSGAMNTAATVTVDGVDITQTAKDNKYVTILSDSEGNAKLAHASTEKKPNGLLNIGSLEFIANQTGVDLSNVYGDYSNAAVEGTHSYSWSAQKTDDGYALTLNNAYITDGEVSSSGTDDNLTVDLIGTNIIDLSDLAGVEEASAVESSNDITFNGTGSLTATSNPGSAFSQSLFIEGDIFVNGPSVTAIGGASASTTGVNAQSITVSAGSLTGIGGDFEYNGTDVAEISSGGIQAQGIDASGGTVTGKGGKVTNNGDSMEEGEQTIGDAYSYGIVLGGGDNEEATTVPINGNVTGIGGTASGMTYGSYGIGIEEEENVEMYISKASIITAVSALDVAFLNAPKIDSKLKTVVKTGTEADGSDAVVVSAPDESTYTENKYVQITTTSAPVLINLPTNTNYGVTLDLTDLNGQNNSPNATPGQDYKGKLDSNNGFGLPDKISITVGGTALTADQFTYDPATGEFVIPGKYINGAIVIKAAGSNTNASGVSFTKSRLKYRITKPSTHAATVTSKSTTVRAAAVSTYGEVTVIGPVKKTYTELTIPAKVTLNGYVYKVRSISAKAFRSNANLESVTVGKYVRAINRSAFSKCSKLATIRFAGKNLTYIGKNAFRTCAQGCEFNVPASKFKAYKKLLAASGLPKGAEIIKY